MNRRSLLHVRLARARRRGGCPLPAWIDRRRRRRKQPSQAWRHGLSLFGDLKYPAGFKQFDYVNATAPKGGTARQIAIGTFDNFNMVVAGVKGTLADRHQPDLRHAAGVLA